MFAIERFVGIGCYVVALLCCCHFVKKTPSLKKVKKILNIYLLILIIMAYFYVPYTTMDLYRIQIEVKRWVSSYSLTDIFGQCLRSSTPGWLSYGYFLGLTRLEGLLPACTALIDYHNIFSVSIITAEPENTYGSKLSDLLFYIMSSGEIYILAIGNIRTAIGLSIVAVCFVNETYHKSNFFKDIPLYLIAASFHQAALIMCAARILIVLVDPIIENGKIPVWNLIALAVILAFFAAKPQVILRFLNSATGKAVNYLTQKYYDYFWERLIGVLNIIVVLVAMLQIRKLKSKSKLKETFWFCALIVLLIILFGNEFAIFRRLSVLLSIIAIPIIGSLLVEDDLCVLKFGGRCFSFQKILNFNSWIVLLLECVRGDLCGYKFFQL